MRPHYQAASYVVALLLFGAQACTYDFDQFREAAPGGDMGGDQGLSDMGGADMGGDIDQDVDADLGPDADLPPSGAAIGAACTNARDCSYGECRAGICTTTCNEDDACPDDTACLLVEPGTKRCVVSCERDADCGAGNLCSAGACLPDADGDSIADWMDNCPQAANPTQQDLDLDGEGDACDADVLCPTGHVDGVRALDLGQMAALGSAASSAASRFVTMSDGAAVWLLDLRTGRAFKHAALPYEASGHGIVELGWGRAWLTPGVGKGQASGQAGRWLGMAADGTITEGGPFTQDARDPVGAVLRFGGMVMAATQASRQAPSTAQLSQVVPTEASVAGMAQYELPEAVALYAMEYGAGEALIYSAPFRAAADQPWQLLMWTVNQDAQVVDGRVVALPNAEGLETPIAPAFVRTRQGLLIALDRVTGQAWRLVVGRPEGEWIRVAGLDVSWGAAPSKIVALRHGAGVIALSEEGGAVVGQQFALACLPGAAQVDADGDGVSDVRDTCPELMEANQEDLDGDGLGDVCDEDDDADGVPDAADVRVVNMDTGETESLAADTDNDGVPNAQDEDDDGDGIPDGRDVWPLDFDNDGLGALEDSDSDNDGYADVEEQQAGTNPRAELSFPGSGRLAWVSGSGASRSVLVAPLAELGSAQAVDFGAGAAPGSVRWAVSSDHILALDGLPGEATEALVQVPGLTVAPERYVFGQKVRSAALVAADPADPAGKPGVVAAHEAEGMSGRWVISRLAWEDASVKRLIVGTLTELGELSGWSDRIYFVGSTARCVGCERAWTQLAREDQQVQAVFPNLSAVREVRRTASTVCVVGSSQEEPASAAWVGAQRRMPPGASEVTRCVPLAQDGHLIVHAQDARGRYALWLFNGRISQWVQLPAALGGALDLDWKQ